MIMSTFLFPSLENGTKIPYKEVGTQEDIVRIPHMSLPKELCLIKLGMVSPSLSQSWLLGTIGTSLCCFPGKILKVIFYCLLSKAS